MRGLGSRGAWKIVFFFPQIKNFPPGLIQMLLLLLLLPLPELLLPELLLLELLLLMETKRKQNGNKTETTTPETDVASPGQPRPSQTSNAAIRNKTKMRQQTIPD